jgi:urea transporter
MNQHCPGPMSVPIKAAGLPAMTMTIVNTWLHLVQGKWIKKKKQQVKTKNRESKIKLKCCQKILFVHNLKWFK